MLIVLSLLVLNYQYVIIIDIITSEGCAADADAKEHRNEGAKEHRSPGGKEQRRTGGEREREMKRQSGKDMLPAMQMRLLLPVVLLTIISIISYNDSDNTNNHNNNNNAGDTGECCLREAWKLSKEA